MTPLQQAMLFGLFGQLAKAQGWDAAQRAEERTTITHALFGEALSWADLTDLQIDALKYRLRGLLEPASITAQIEDEEATAAGERRRLLHRILADARAGGLAEAYLKAVCRNLYDRADWAALPLPELRNFRDTIAQRARSKRRQAKAGNRGSAKTQREEATAAADPF